MKVKELIKKLKKIDGDLEVKVRDFPYLSSEGKIESDYESVISIGFGWDCLLISSDETFIHEDEEEET